jgi:hypothetical protein
MRLVALAAAVVVLVVFAGTVGGTSKQTAAEARYALEVEAWCTRWWAEYATLGQPQTMPEWASWLTRSAPLVTEQEREFAKLDPPASYRREAARIRAHISREKPIARKMHAAARRGDEGTFERLVASLEPEAREWYDAMRRIGASGCVAGAAG